MKILDEDIKYYITGDDKILFERAVFTELVYRIHNMEKQQLINTNVNTLINKRVDQLTSLLWNIRDYLIECKQDKTSVDIDELISWLD